MPPCAKFTSTPLCRAHHRRSPSPTPWAKLRRGRTDAGRIRPPPPPDLQGFNDLGLRVSARGAFTRSQRAGCRDGQHPLLKSCSRGTRRRDPGTAFGQAARDLCGPVMHVYEQIEERWNGCTFHAAARMICKLRVLHHNDCREDRGRVGVIIVEASERQRLISTLDKMMKERSEARTALENS